VWYYRNLPRCHTRWHDLDHALSKTLNMLQTEESRPVLHSIADYNQTILHPAWLAKQMQQQIKMRHDNFDQAQPHLETFREQARQAIDDQLDTTKL